MPDEPRDDVVTLRMDGAAEHRGHVLARALVAKMDQFLKAFGAFERAYLGKRIRQTDFEVVTLSHRSPSEIGLHPVTRVEHYLPAAAVNWTLEQWDRIARGEMPADLVDEELIADVADLAQHSTPLDYSAFSIEYRSQKIAFDQRAATNANSIRQKKVDARRKLPWRTGISLGSMTGELRSVLDEQGERLIVILPPIGPDRVRCVFPEGMRDKIRDNLFRFVRIHGLLHYSDSSPHPFLIEMDNIETLDYAEPAGHFLEARGLFANSTYPVRPSDIL